ncbi:MAG: hypothetical protein AAF432_14600 [Planctomycetota bacterium]
MRSKIRILGMVAFALLGLGLLVSCTASDTDEAADAVEDAADAAAATTQGE